MKEPSYGPGLCAWHSGGMERWDFWFARILAGSCFTCCSLSPTPIPLVNFEAALTCPSLCSLCPGHRDGDVNERDVIPALRWKLARSSGKPSLWGSSHLSWSELHPFKDFWAKPASPKRQKPPPSLPLILSPWCSRLSPQSLLPKLRGSHLLPAALGQCRLCLDLACQPSVSSAFPLMPKWWREEHLVGGWSG